MSVEENKALVLRWFATEFPGLSGKSHTANNPKEELGKTLRSLVEEIFAPDFKVSFSGGYGDREYVIQMTTEMAYSFPDTIFKVDKMLAEDEVIAFLGRSQGTHLNEYRGIPATGTKIENHYMAMVRIADGKIAQEWIFFDPSDFKQQFGFVVPPR